MRLQVHHCMLYGSPKESRSLSSLFPTKPRVVTLPPTTRSLSNRTMPTQRSNGALINVSKSSQNNRKDQIIRQRTPVMTAKRQQALVNALMNGDNQNLTLNEIMKKEGL
mmetsp:Transcript_53106/g.68112  ORF Transcript_53106/g.68112 Transcript_53106/m.68112 type:complete len:109 (-) Transcript_53106:2-328(-)